MYLLFEHLLHQKLNAAEKRSILAITFNFHFSINIPWAQSVFYEYVITVLIAIFISGKVDHENFTVFVVTVYIVESIAILS